MHQESSQDQILRDLLRLLRRQRLLVLAAVIIAAGAGAAYSILKTAVYEASADLQFNDQSQDLAVLGLPVPLPQDPARQAAAASEVITSKRVVDAVFEKLDGELSRDAILDSVETSVDSATNLVTIATTADNADLAARIANEFARQTRLTATATERTRLRQAARRAQRSLRRGDPTAETEALTGQRVSVLLSLASIAKPVEIVTAASPPGSPASPKPVRDTLLAMLLGLIFGLLAAFVRDSLDRRLTDAHEIQHQLHVPMVGYVDAEALGGVGFTRNGMQQGTDPGIESFRILRSNVEFLAGEGAIRTVAVSSPVAEEGKSTVAAGLATASALAGKRVLLIECDLRRPVLAERFKLAAQPGLTDWIAGNVKPADVVQATRIDQDRPAPQETAQQVGVETGILATIVAGSPTSRPAEQLASERFRTLLSQVRKVYDLVVLDCAPLLPVGDALEILPYVDGTLICIRLDQTTREQAAAAKSTVDHLPQRPIGLVITGVRPGREGYYYGYYTSVPSRPPIFVQQPPSAG